MDTKIKLFRVKSISANNVYNELTFCVENDDTCNPNVMVAALYNSKVNIGDLTFQLKKQWGVLKDIGAWPPKTTTNASLDYTYLICPLPDKGQLLELLTFLNAHNINKDKQHRVIFTSSYFH